jgi:hypothetical protein
MAVMKINHSHIVEVLDIALRSAKRGSVIRWDLVTRAIPPGAFVNKLEVEFLTYVSDAKKKRKRSTNSKGN